MKYCKLLVITVAVVIVYSEVSWNWKLEISSGRFLNTNIYRRFTVQTVYQCVEHCLASSLCTSINFRRDVKECHLNLDDPSKPLYKSSKYLHIYLRNAPKFLTMSCDGSCPPSTRCIPGNGSGICIPEDDICNDINVFCPSWRQTGQCPRNGSFKFVRYFCRKSCDTCHLPSPLLEKYYSP